ncbi:hypothetical protein MVES1_000182 [Malassezia vespertilionis]|uniref:uncharacterized protein n=1 Tax=Malassezia vespertilionis TaxID=2020962 RepID=UPI0024B0B663|nr:uncharacterized protein MVES1_000182 [Malassezia vespertilionis]WFD04858.1 hypothetical protein MVES1_000182 [Malassezia vespertilionis]
MLRGDLTRTVRSTEKKGSSVVLVMGRYAHIGEEAVLRPPAKTHQGYVKIGCDCVIGPFCVVRDCAVVEDGAVLAPNTVVPSMAIFRGNPARLAGWLPESFAERWEDEIRAQYAAFDAPDTT